MPAVQSVSRSGVDAGFVALTKDFHAPCDEEVSVDLPPEFRGEMQEGCHGPFGRWAIPLMLLGIGCGCWTGLLVC